MMAGRRSGQKGQHGGRHLRHGIFFAMGATIVLSVVIAGFVVHAAAGSAKEQYALQAFANDRFRSVWDEVSRREDLARSVESHFKVRLTLRDAAGKVLYGTGSTCERGSHRLEVREGSRVLGRVEACMASHRWSHSLVLGLSILILALWAMSGFIARMLVRPLDDLVKVVRDIGEGHLDARIQLCRYAHRGELGAVAYAVNSMAEKIERQIAGQRELLAAVSHEIRSPLARLRVLVELERDGQGDSSRLDSMELELKEMDSLVGLLLAQSRLEFQNLERRSLLAVDVAQMVLERASISMDALIDEAMGAEVTIDVSLLARALLNLLDNAQRHGRGLAAFAIRVDANWVRFEIRDQGPGFDAALLPRAFEPFVSGPKGGGLGLGLSLVDRIVRAHGGRVRLANAEQGGAVVTLELPRTAKS